MKEVTMTDEGTSHINANGDGRTPSAAIRFALGLPEGENMAMDNKICYILETVEEGEMNGAFDSGTVEVHVDEPVVEIGGEPLQIDEGSTVITPPSKKSMAQLSQQLKPRVMLLGMRKKWQEGLKNKRPINCPVPGCHLKFFTLISFEKHYMWCTGEKGEGVERCSYCGGRFLTSDLGIVEHVSQDHPEKLVEYKAFKRALACKNKKPPPVRNKKDDVVYMNNSGNVDKVVSTNGLTTTVMSSTPSDMDGDKSEDMKPPTFSTKQFQIRKMSPNQDKKDKLKNEGLYFCHSKRAAAKKVRFRRAQNLRPHRNMTLEEEEQQQLPRLRKFPGTARIMLLPEGIHVKVYPQRKRLVGIVTENSRNWSAPRRTYSRSSLS